MKQIYLFGIFIFISHCCHAQNTFPETGNAGIGTLTPLTNLHINSNLSGMSAIGIGYPWASGNVNVPLGGSPGGYNIDFYTWRDVVQHQVGARLRAERINVFEPNNALVQAMDLSFFTSLGGVPSNLTEKMRITYDGKVGIGITTPLEKLHIVEEGLLRPTFEAISSTDHHRPILDFKRSRGTIIAKLPVKFNDKLGNFYFRGYDGTDYLESSGFGGVTEADATPGVVKSGVYFSTNDGTDMVSNVPKIKMYLTSSGNFLINPKVNIQGNLEPGSLIGEGKLQVRGLIRAQEVKVEVANWPDYVFANNYSLPSLEETEKYIKEKGHLPGIPTAAEAAKNGIELGDMNKKLLQKIEELTLYLIEMKKTTDAQIADLKTEIKNLKSN